jgi:hypothetical protein
MLWVGRHAVAVGVVAFAVGALGAVFALARPVYRPHVTVAKDVMPPYSKVSYSSTDVRRVFAQERVALAIRSHGPMGTTLGNRHGVLEVDVFGDPVVLKNAGFHDLVLGPSCTGTRLAERWEGNVRVIVNCAITSDGQRWLGRVQRALSRLRTST